jgi:hypothetical protein
VVNFHEIQQGGHAIEDDLDTIIFNPIAPTILNQKRFELLRWMQKLHQLALDYQQLSLVTIVTRPFLCDS